jgi:hypothetical protein
MAQSLWPKTLGPWVHVVVPVTTALALARPNAAAWLFAAAAMALFLAREPAVLALGYRGEEVRREEGWRARRLVRIFLAIGIACLAVAFFLGNARVRMSMGGPLVLWTLLGVLTVRHEDKTFNGELLAGVACASAGFPIATAEGISLRISIDVWVAWGFGFFAASAAMRSLLEKGDRRRLQGRAFTFLGVLTGIGLFTWLFARASAGFAPAVPMIATSWAVAALRPKKHKRAAAIALAVSSVATGAVLVYLTRAPG